MIKKLFTSETKAVEGNERQMVVRISTASPDRSNDIVVPTGAMLENYWKNPVVAAFHKYDQPAIANTVALEVKDESIDATIEWVPEGTYELADILHSQYKSGHMSGWSIGFIPKEIEPRENAGYGFVFKKWELLEFSAVLVPDNQDAITLLRSKGIEPSIEQNEIEALQVKIATLEEAIASLTTQLTAATETVAEVVPEGEVKQLSGIAKLHETLKFAEAQRNEALQQLYTALHERK